MKYIKPEIKIHELGPRKMIATSPSVINSDDEHSIGNGFGDADDTGGGAVKGETIWDSWDN